MTKPTEEQLLSVTKRQIAEAVERAKSGNRKWDFYYSPLWDAHRRKQMLRESCSALVPRELVTMTEGG